MHVHQHWKQHKFFFLVQLLPLLFLFNFQFSFLFVVCVRRMRTLLFVDAARLLDSSKLILKRSAAETKTNLWDSQTMRRRRQRCLMHAEHQQTKTSFFCFPPRTKTTNSITHASRVASVKETDTVAQRSHCAAIVSRCGCEQYSTLSIRCSLLSRSAHVSVCVCAFVRAAAAKRTNGCA